MKSASFKYEKPSSLNELQQILVDSEGAGKIMAGGQSLGAMLNLRLARPALLVDLQSLPELTQVEDKGAFIRYGAAVRHVDFEDGNVTDAVNGMLQSVASGIAHRAVRNRGTIGGSLVHADPAADWILTMPTVNAVYEILTTKGLVELPAHEFMQGAFTTSMDEGDILTAIRIPKYSDETLWGYYKLCRKLGEFAEANAAVVIDPAARYCRIVMGALGGAPILLEELASCLASKGIEAALAEIPRYVSEALPDHSAVARRPHEVAVKRAILQIGAR